MRKMAEPIRTYNIKKGIKAFLLGLLIGASMTGAGLIFKSYVSFRDRDIVKYHSNCVSYKKAIEELQPVAFKGNSYAIEEFNALIKKFEESGCNQFYPLFR